MLLSGLFTLLWPLWQLSFIRQCVGWTAGLKRSTVMDVDPFQGDRNGESSKTTGFTTTYAPWRWLSQHWVELGRREDLKEFSGVMGGLISMPAALEDWVSLLWKTEAELSAEVHYGNWKKLKGNCQDSLLIIAWGGTEWQSISLEGPFPHKLEDVSIQVPACPQELPFPR